MLHLDLFESQTKFASLLRAMFSAAVRVTRESVSWHRQSAGRQNPATAARQAL
jgi:hypothetical protein